MAGYLDQYGAGEERRLKIIRNVVILAAVLLVTAGVLFFILHNYRQEQQVKRFFDLLAHHDYPAAYELWVRTDSDRKGYPMEAFLRDWGPQGSHPDINGYSIARSRSCG